MKNLIILLQIINIIVKLNINILKFYDWNTFIVNNFIIYYFIT